MDSSNQARASSLKEPGHVPAADIARNLDFDADKILQDITDMVICYCAKGFDAFDEKLLTSVVFNKEEIQAALQGSLQIYAMVLDQLQTGLAQFAEKARMTTLRMPQILAPVTRPEPLGPVPPGEEERLDKELQQAREDIRSAQVSTRKYQMETSVFQRDLQAAGNTDEFLSLSGMIDSNKENLGRDVASIASCTEAMQPALEKAEAILKKYTQQKAGRPLTNAAVLEKEVSARKAASKGLTSQDMKHFRQVLSAGE